VGSNPSTVIAVKFRRSLSLSELLDGRECGLEGKPKRYVPFWLFKEPHMPRLTHKIPSYRLHKASGQAVVTLNGRDHYLGPHGSPESQEAYRRVLQEVAVSNRRQLPRTPDTVSAASTINELIVAFWHHTESYYVKDRNLTPESGFFTFPLDTQPCAAHYDTADLPVEFDKERLKARV
jgi:hypothetical protein